MGKYSINDLRGTADSIRMGVATSFSESYTENLDDFISIDQIISIVKKHSIGQDDDGHHIITESIFNDIFNEVRDWIYGVALAKLAAQGSIECAWDNDANEMYFWLADKKNTPISNKPSNE